MSDITGVRFGNAELVKLGVDQVFRILSSVPMFAALDDDLRLSLARRMIPLAYSAGAVVMKEGSLPDALYLVASGRLRASVHRDGEDLNVGDIGRGEIAGEMGLLTDEPRSATVRAARDSVVLNLSKIEFSAIMESHPSALAEITRMVISRMRQTLAGSGTGPSQVRTIAIVPAGPAGEVPLEVFSSRLSKALSRFGRTMLLSSELLSSQLARIDSIKTLGERTLIRREGLRSLTGQKTSLAEDPGLDIKITEWLHNVESSHDTVVYQADAKRTPWTVRCLRQADRILLVARADASSALGEIEAELFDTRRADENTPAAWRDPELVLLHGASTKLPSNTAAWLERRPVKRHYHFKLTSDPHFERLARVLTGSQISVVFSGGGARGAAHVGVLKALEEHGIPIDFIAGTSFGSIMAAGPALGWTADELRHGIYRSLVAPGRPLDFTAPYCALALGRKATDRIRAVFSDIRIEDMWLPYFCISSNITVGTQVVHDRGPLWRAIRASVAIPGILPPLRSLAGDVLIDGAVMNNLPVDLMRERSGGEIFAVNLRGPVRLPADDLDDSGILSGWPLFARWINPFARRPSVPSILELILRTSEIGNLLSSQQQESSADLTFTPAVDKYRMLEFKAYEQLIKAGYDEGMERLNRWRGLSTLGFQRQVGERSDSQSA